MLRREAPRRKGHVRESDLRLQQEIKGVDFQIKRVEVNPHHTMAAQTRSLLGRLAARGIVLKLADLPIGL